MLNEYVYTTIKNEKIFITHGDCFDGLIKTNKYLYWFGDLSYEFSIKINNIISVTVFFGQVFRWFKYQRRKLAQTCYTQTV